MTWSGKTLEQALKEAFRENRENELLGALKILPPEKREFYRNLWTELKQERAKKKNELADQTRSSQSET